MNLLVLLHLKILMTLDSYYFIFIFRVSVLLDFPECGATEFICDSKRCIDMNMRCDGKPDCNFGEDEHECSKFLLFHCETVKLCAKADQFNTFNNMMFYKCFQLHTNMHFVQSYF